MFVTGIRASYCGCVPRAGQRGWRSGASGCTGPRGAAARGGRALGGRTRRLQPAEGIPASAARPAAHRRPLPGLHRLLSTKIIFTSHF